MKRSPHGTGDGDNSSGSKRPKRGRNATADTAAHASQSSRGTAPKTKKLVQSKLFFTGETGPTVCSVCGWTYRKNSPEDKASHAKNHDVYVNGVVWSHGLKMSSLEFTTRPEKTKVTIVEVDPGSEAQVRRTHEVLKFFNDELNASEGSDQWKTGGKGSTSAKAFLAIISSRVVGICTTELIDKETQSRWMVHRTKSIVENQVNKNMVIGVSRIWVLHKWRRSRIARSLLDVVMSKSVYGVKLQPKEVGFSQPSTSGGLLAKSFNGVVHKSGETLIPVYLED